MRKQLRLKPLSYIYDLSQAPLNSSPLAGNWPCLNVMVSSNRIVRRWDHEIYRTLDSTEVIQSVPIFRTNTGSQYTLILTDTDLAKVTGATDDETYQYLTDTYTTGSITGISDTTVTGTGTDWENSGLEAGDKFILDDDHSAAEEPSPYWATIESITDGTHLELSAAYTGAETTGTYKARKVHSCPMSERWQYASVAGTFCFTNGNIAMQYWDGTSDYSTTLDTAYCNQVRYCTSYANRLVMADMYDADTSARNPWKVRWSAEGDPTDWTDDTAGFNDFIDTQEPIVGIATSGDNLFVFKKTSYYIGTRTGQATNPIVFPDHNKGVGLYASYSLVNVAGTIAWMGIDDFYVMNGAMAVSIGEDIRSKFFSLVSDDEARAVFGINNIRYNEVLWVANTSDGQYIFSYNWKEKGIHSGSWTTHKLSNNLTGLGGFGGI
jgi:hypothetical protein